MTSVELLDKINKCNKFEAARVQVADVKLALKYLEQYHDGQFRFSGEPFFHHPIEVAYIVMDYFCDTETILAALLHDIVEDSTMSINQIDFLFGEQVALLVNKLTKLDGAGMKLKLSDLESSHKLIQLNERSSKAITIKLADRLHNMRTIEYHKSIDKKQQIALETLQVFVPMALYVGIKEIEVELQSLAFKVLNQ